MGEKIIIGPINKGLNTSRTAFVIDNDSFPTLYNAYQWRGRVKRKRGTSFLGRLTRFFNSQLSSYNPTSLTLTLDGSGNRNLLTDFGLQTNGNIVPGSINLTIGGTLYTDPGLDGTLSPNGTINYGTGDISVPLKAGQLVTGTFLYYPDLPVLGIEDFTPVPTQFPLTIAFDDVYSYNVSTASPYPINDVSFYKNPAASASLPGYVPKTNPTPTTWNGEDYQQYWSANYQGALWVTNGIPIPFVSTNIGMQYKPIVTVDNITTGPPAIVDLTINSHGLVVGDFVYINEVTGTTGINFQTGYVIAVVSVNKVTVEFPNATINTNGSGGIAQYLTNRSDPTKDSLRWYDGDPTNGNSTNPTFVPGNGWVNFSPPISQFPFSIGDLPPAIYYLVGARMIIPFKDRILFLGVVVENKGGGIFYLQDTIVYSQNGTPYYTASFTNKPVATVDTPIDPLIIFNPILVPANQTATAAAYFGDQTGFGGFTTAGLDQPITTASFNEDVIIIGFSFTQTRLVYSGSDIDPFNFYYINSEYGSASPFSSINMDKGVITRGTRGYIITSQTNCQRIDLDIPDQVFEMNLTQNGNERLCAARDFINEWIYFTYPENNDSFRYPNQTLMWNYRDNSYAIFYESYTTYGQFRRQTGFIWSTVGLVFPTWKTWNEPWDSGDSTLLQTEVMAGNQQGFLLIRDEGTGEGTSLYIRGINGVTNVITSPDHNLVDGDYIVISGVLGAIGQNINGLSFSISNVSQDTFVLNMSIPIGSGTYVGGGLITKIYVPLIQTKQFPTAWVLGRKTRIGVQQYLLTTTANSQITLQIYLSQNATNPYNTGAVVPAASPNNSSLEYSTVLYTCPESTNLGLTPANINLQMVTASSQLQTWHRINTSLIGDTVQLGFTLSDSQILDNEVVGPPFSIIGVVDNTYPTVLMTTAEISISQLVLIEDVVGMTQLNGNIYQVISSTTDTVTINVDSTLFSDYVSGGIITQVAGNNSFAEIELHSIILDISPSQMLA